MVAVEGETAHRAGGPRHPIKPVRRLSKTVLNDVCLVANVVSITEMNCVIRLEILHPECNVAGLPGPGGPITCNGQFKNLSTICCSERIDALLAPVQIRDKWVLASKSKLQVTPDPGP